MSALVYLACCWFVMQHRISQGIPLLGLDLPRELTMDVNKPYGHAIAISALSTMLFA